MKKLTKKQTMVSAICILVIAGGGLFAYGKHNSSVKIAEAKETLKLSNKELESLDKRINELYDTEDSNFLKESINESEITQLEKEVSKETNFNKKSLLKNSDYADYDKKVSDLNKKMGTTKNKYSALITLNNMFNKDTSDVAINGSKVNSELSIVDDLSSETVESAKNKYFTEGATSTYDKALNDLLTNAESQLNQLAVAKEATGKLFVDGQVTSTDSALYDTAKAEIDKIKNEKAKNELNDQLAKVKEAIDSKTTTEQQVAEAATQSAEATNNANASANTNQGSGTQSYANGSGSAGTASNGNTGSASASQNQGSGSNAASSSTGNGRGVMTQDDLNKAAEDASTSDWSSFFP